MDFPSVIPFPISLGFKLERYHGGEAQIAVELRPDLLNAFGVAHGGLTMTLLDVVMAHAARSPGQPGLESSPGVVTIEMKTSFMLPGQGRLVGHGRVLHRTASMVFCEGRVLDPDGHVTAHATGTFKIVRTRARAQDDAAAGDAASPRTLVRPLRGEGSD
jgi:uncharacterized protein (TIGR00369 family)